jgi:hypothetical protein
MAARAALAALISLGLAILGVAALHVAEAEAEAAAGATAHAALSADCACGPAPASPCEGAERPGQLGWNAASWLVGLGLVAAIGRGKRTPG